MGAFADTKAQIKTILDGITGSGKALAESFDYIEPTPQQFPAAMVELAGASGEDRLDSASNWLSPRYVIRVAVKKSDNTSATSALVISTLEAVLDELRKSVNVDTLGGTVERFDINDIIPFSDDRGNIVIDGFDIFVTGAKIQSIT